MKKISCNFLLTIGLMMLLSAGTVFAAHLESSVFVKDDPKIKIPKNMSMLQVETDEPMVVYVDGVEVGKTQGNKIKFYHAVTPGLHEVRIAGMTGEVAPFVQTVEYRKGVSNCICLQTVRKKVETPCPYDIQVDVTQGVKDGDLITFTARNIAPVAGAAALSYVWKVSPANARITSGLGTSVITVDSTGLGGQQVFAEVEATNGFYDEQCRQRIRSILLWKNGRSFRRQFMKNSVRSFSAYLMTTKPVSIIMPAACKADRMIKAI